MRNFHFGDLGKGGGFQLKGAFILERKQKQHRLQTIAAFPICAFIEQWSVNSTWG